MADSWQICDTRSSCATQCSVTWTARLPACPHARPAGTPNQQLSAAARLQFRAVVIFETLGFRSVCLFPVLFLAVGTPMAAAATIVAETSGDASISRDTATGRWTLAAGGATLTVLADAAHDFQLQSLVSASGQNWLSNSTAGTTVTADGTTAAFGSHAAGWVFSDAATSSNAGRLQLDAAFVLHSANLLVTRHVAVANASPTFEMWTTYQARSVTPVTLSNLNAIEIAVPQGQVRWLTGLQGDSADADVATAFTLKQQSIAAGAVLSLGADGRSSAQTVPWFAIDGAHDEFYAA